MAWQDLETRIRLMLVARVINENADRLKEIRARVKSAERSLVQFRELLYTLQGKRKCPSRTADIREVGERIDGMEIKLAQYQKAEYEFIPRPEKTPEQWVLSYLATEEEYERINTEIRLNPEPE